MTKEEKKTTIEDLENMLGQRDIILARIKSVNYIQIPEVGIRKLNSLIRQAYMLGLKSNPSNQ